MTIPAKVNLRHQPEIKHLRENNTSSTPETRMVRFYMSDPEGYRLQIWRGRSVTTAYLTNDEATQLCQIVSEHMKETA